jgi:hypothetical protein
MTKQKPESTLMRAFEFTATDLAANIAGHLSPAQKEQLKSGLHWLIGFIIVIVIGLVLLAFGLWSPYGTCDLWNVYCLEQSEVLVLALIILVLGPVVALLDRSSSRAIRKGQVSAIRGRVNLKTVRPWKTEHYLAQIDRTTFHVSQGQFHALIDGEPYCLYYISGVHDPSRGSRRILSVQPLNIRRPQAE